MDAALQKLRADGAEVLDEDIERLSPLAHSHINVLGRYHLALPEEVLRGQLRPLRDPTDPGDILDASSVSALWERSYNLEPDGGISCGDDWLRARAPGCFE